MSSKIKGLNIKIGADMTGLDDVKLKEKLLDAWKY